MIIIVRISLNVKELTSNTVLPDEGFDPVDISGADPTTVRPLLAGMDAPWPQCRLKTKRGGPSRLQDVSNRLCLPLKVIIQIDALP